jgi:23S rRNA (cytosine1962-C5)-methyltransferase
VTALPRLTLKPGHVKPVWAGHPWVYAQAVGRLEGTPAAGDVVEVADPEGRFLGRGFWSPGSALPVRLLTRRADEAVDDDLLRRRVVAAAARRARLLGLPSNATDGFRLVHAEGDELPGLVVDRFGSTACVQLVTAGMKRREEAIFDALAALPGIERVIEVAAGEAQRREGIEVVTRAVRGPALAGAEDALDFHERGFAFTVPLAVAQKTGWYFDQRDNRERVESLAAGRRVLDACTYLGGFALAAARGGASAVVAVDRNEAILAAARAGAERNGLGGRIEWRVGDVRRDLGRWADAGERFDLVVLDPPKLAPTARHLDRARPAYEGLNGAALRLVAPGGVLATCSCSAALGPEELLRLVAVAARRVGRHVAVLAIGGQSADHPTPAAFPEGRYLTCAFLAVD